jgi:hypothetical protein
MNTPLIQKLREHLASISKEQFRKEWSEIESLGLDGPNYEEFIQSLSASVLVNNIIQIENFESSVDIEFTDVSEGDSNFALAA